MLGRPKYKIGDKVRFDFSHNDEKIYKEGLVYIIDERGTFFDRSDVSYDIMVEEENCLYKHINEKHVVPIV